MHPLRRKLPSLNCLYAIDAVARHQSFSAAAKELGVSQPAVSKAIKTAEAHIGFQLFERRANGLGYTPEGKAFCTEVAAVLDRLLDVASAASSDRVEKTISLCFSPSFVSLWLLPRLPEFQAQHPDIAFRISENTRRVTLPDTPFDFSTRLGVGDWEDVDAWPFAPEVIHAVAAPEYVQAKGGLEDVSALQRARLLHAVEAHRARMDWSGWLRAAGEGINAPNDGMVFSDYHAAVQAAVLGQGVALGWAHLVQSHVAAGRLQYVGGTSVRTGKIFYLVSPRARRLADYHQIFRDWMVQTATRGDPQPLVADGT